MKEKWRKLIEGLIADGIGYLSYIPGLEIIDIIWAPISYKIIENMYGNKFFSWLQAIEELLPLTDIIPTFTIAWIYTYYIKKVKT